MDTVASGMHLHSTLYLLIPNADRVGPWRSDIYSEGKGRKFKDSHLEKIAFTL